MHSYCAFISYTRADREPALQIHRELLADGLTAWIDVECLEPGAPVDPTIRRAIRESRYFLAVISKRSVDKEGYMLGEISRAVDELRKYAETQSYLIPVRLDDTRPTSHEALQTHAWLDLFPDWNVGMQRLVRTLRGGCK
jgi:hypothetical protein